MKTVLLSVLFAFLTHLALAIPPACLLHAVNTQDEPSDLRAICGTGALTVQGHMADNCGTYEADAQRAFLDTCSSAGTSVAAYTATASSGASATATGTGGVTSTARSSVSATGSAGSTQSTAGAYHYREGLSPMAAAAVALVGAVAAL